MPLAPLPSHQHNENMKNETVTASEIGDYVFCAESARLRHIGHESANQPQLERGTADHARAATIERAAGGSIALGRLLLAMAVLGALAWAFS